MCFTFRIFLNNLKINIGEKEIVEAYSPMSISLSIIDDIDISRGDMIVKENNIPISTKRLVY